ncbi:MAG: autoinducer binding domain-containing protein [Thermodesulfobacteriota bacterium]
MNVKDFSKSELIGVLKAVEFSTQCSNEGHIRQLIINVKELIGAEHSICAMGRLSPNGVSDVMTVVNGDYPEEWVTIYKSEELHKADPVVRFHTRFCGTQLWADTFQRYTDAESRQFLNHAADFRLHYGISSGVYVPGAESRSIFSFGGFRDTYEPHHKKIVDYVTLHLHKAFVRICRSNRQTVINVPTLYYKKC